MKHTIRINGEEVEGTKTIEPYTRGLAIKVMCTECMGYEGSPQKDCTSERCPLYPYRGKTRIARVVACTGTLTDPVK